METHARRDGLLAGVLMDRAAHMAGLERRTGGLLEFADDAHRAKHCKYLVARRFDALVHTAGN
jgi:hypothetical protein